MSDGRLAGQSREWTAEPSAGPPSASPSVPAPDSARRPSSLEAGGAAAGADSRWQRVEALFHGLMTIEPGQRDQQLAAWCGEDVALRQELLALLAADAAVQELMACAPEAESSELRMRRPEAGEALLPVAAGCDLSGEEVAARPAAGASPGLVAGMAAERVAEALVGLPGAMRPPIDVGSDLRVGSTIGPFVLEALLGRGGMGVVYRARRTSGGLAQIVAIKVIAWYLRSSPAVSQFLLEREALAQLEHAHVTRLIDGGIWQGTPYLVMEYVEGRRLDEFCDGVRDGTEARAAIPLREKLRLILQLCEALSYVHRNLILHRDLKPGNVMVTSDGSVKLLDFGTLKLMAATAADSDMTRAGMRPVTLRYASPEHIRGETVSTASEVYSLGMILYRVLAGRLPEGLGELLAGPELRLDEEDGASSLERYLGWLKQRPLPPPALAARATDPAERRLAHDLEAIVSKAVRYEPESRYATVDALAADLRRALGNRPIAARAGTLRYRLGRFYHRHTYPVLGTAAVVLVLATGLALVAGQSAIARGEQRRAEMGVEDERRLAHLLLFDYFEQLKQVPASTGAQRQAVTEALRYLDSLTHIPLGSPLELDKVQAYTEMGVLLGDPYEENLGDAAGATRTLQKILPEALKMSAAAPGDRVLLQAAAAVQTALGQVANGSGHARQALTYLEPAAAASRRIAASPGVTVPMLVQSAYVLNSFGDVYGQQSDYSLHQTETAMRIFGESLAVNQKALALDQHCSRCRSGVALAYWKLGMMAREEDENRAAEYYRDGLATLAVFSPAEQATTRIRRMDTFIRHRLGEIYLSNGHPQDGVRLLEMTRERFRLAVAADMLDARPRWDLGPLDLTLGDGYVQLKQYQKAVEAYREYVEMMNFLVHRVPESSTYQEARAEALLKYGELESRLGHKAAGEASSNEGLALVLSMAQKPAAETNELDLAVNALVDRNHRRDAPLALVLAQREIAASESVSVDQLLTLARAQRFAGLVAQSQDTVRKALRLLAVHPHSMDNTAEREQARKLLAG